MIGFFTICETTNHYLEDIGATYNSIFGWLAAGGGGGETEQLQRQLFVLSFYIPFISFFLSFFLSFFPFFILSLYSYSCVCRISVWSEFDARMTQEPVD